MATIYLNGDGNAPATSDGKIILGDCCCPPDCVYADIIIDYHYSSSSGNRYRSPLFKCTYVRKRDSASVSETSFAHASVLDAGPCKDTSKSFWYQNNHVENGGESSDGSSWDYLLHRAIIYQPGTVTMIRHHCISSQGSGTQLGTETYTFRLILGAHTKISWSFYEGSEPDCSASSVSFNHLVRSGDVDSNTYSSWGGISGQYRFVDMQIQWRGGMIPSSYFEFVISHF